MKSGGVDYSTSGDHLPEETIDQMEEYKQRIIDGDLTVPSTVGQAKQ
jgi:basic membrane lipoprotein Med (substrate-binding protein (PBP1-ABC) superfamily)